MEKRSRVGHWEGDTVIGKGNRQAIISLVDVMVAMRVLRMVSKKTS